MRPFRHADALAAQVFGGFDALVAVHIERRKPKQPRGIDWQTDNVGILPRHLRCKLGEGQLRDVPFAVEGEARENFVMAEREPGRLDAYRANVAEPEIAEVIVVAGGDGEFDGHDVTLGVTPMFSASLRYCPRSWPRCRRRRDS